MCVSVLLLPRKTCCPEVKVTQHDYHMPAASSSRTRRRTMIANTAHRALVTRTLCKKRRSAITPPRYPQPRPAQVRMLVRAQAPVWHVTAETARGGTLLAA